MSSLKIHVGNLSWNTNDESLRQAVGIYSPESYDSIMDLIVMRDRETGRSRGFGFVTFTNHDAAQAALENLNDQEVDGRWVRVNFVR